MNFIQNLWLILGLWQCVCLCSLGNATPTPVVLWHGIGDTSEGLPKLVKRLLEDNIQGIYVKRLRIGRNAFDEFQDSFFMHPNVQVSIACRQIQDDPKLSQGYNGIGFSQGGLFIRALVQRCSYPPMKNLITLAAPHQGVYGLPRCQYMQMGICEQIRNFLYIAAYKSSTQKLLVPASYWHDPFNENLYKTHSTFLSDVNNERRTNKDYTRNLQKLENFVMVKFRNDTVTQPRETHWFEFYVPGQDKEILPLNQSKLYIEDKLGLAKMDRNGQLVFLELDGEHLVYSDDWFKQNILQYLTK